jgi:hypothetical protein
MGLAGPPDDRGPALRAIWSLVRPPAVPYAAFAVFAAMVALFAGQAPHRLWGSFAAIAYGCAALASLSRPARAWHLPLVAALGGAVLAPLGWLRCCCTTEACIRPRRRWRPGIRCTATTRICRS